MRAEDRFKMYKAWRDSVGGRKLGPKTFDRIMKKTVKKWEYEV